MRTQGTGISRKEACLLSQEDTEKVGFIGRFNGFLLQVQQEMKLVDRPNWLQVRSTTMVVLVFVFLVAFYLRALDWVFSPLDRWIFTH
jgi:preprotein translocase SecE subunit